MKLVRIEREISSKVFVGGYETVEPKIRVVGELDSDDNLDEAFKLIDAAAQSMWAAALAEDIAVVSKRRTASSTTWSDDRTASIISQEVPALK